MIVDKNVFKKIKYSFSRFDYYKQLLPSLISCQLILAMSAIYSSLLPSCVCLFEDGGGAGGNIMSEHYVSVIIDRVRGGGGMTVEVGQFKI